jgi:hypothetical protein
MWGSAQMDWFSFSLLTLTVCVFGTGLALCLVKLIEDELDSEDGE